LRPPPAPSTVSTPLIPTSLSRVAGCAYPCHATGRDQAAIARRPVHRATDARQSITSRLVCGQGPAPTTEVGNVVLASARPSLVGPDRSDAGVTRAERPAGAILRDRDNKVVGTLTIEVLGGADPDDPIGDQTRQAQERRSGGGACAVVRELSGLAGPRIDRKIRLRSRHVSGFNGNWAGRELIRREYSLVRRPSRPHGMALSERGGDRRQHAAGTWARAITQLFGWRRQAIGRHSLADRSTDPAPNARKSVADQGYCWWAILDLNQ
jgi:hypothetical protein